MSDLRHCNREVNFHELKRELLGLLGLADKILVKNNADSTDHRRLASIRGIVINLGKDTYTKGVNPITLVI